MPKDLKDKEDDSQEVTMTQGQLKQMLDRLAHLEQQGAVGVSLDEPEFYTARVRIFNDLPVTRLANVTRTGLKAQDGSEVMMCDVTTVGFDGKEETHSTDYLKFIRECPEVTAKVVKRIKKDATKVLGKRMKITMGEWKGEATGAYVTDKVVMHAETFEMELPNGKVVALSSVNL